MVPVKATTAARHLVAALERGSVRWTRHALEMLAAADLSRVFAERDLEAASNGEVTPSRAHTGRFVAHGRRLVFIFEIVAPDVVVVTAFPKE